jgi:predicted Zn-dependent protease
MMKNPLLLFAGLVTIVSSGCSTNPVTGRLELSLVSTAEEMKIGAEEAKKVEAEVGLFDDQKLSAYLNALGQRLAAESPWKEVSYRFHIVDMAEPNAFALPGGYVYVSRGLLALVNGEDELAGVVGHEIAHVAARHSVQRISKQGPLAAIFGIASGVTGLVVPVVGDIVGGIGDFTQSLVFAPYSRSQETEADRVGQEIEARAGWDPAALPVFLDTLNRETELAAGKRRKPSFFDSHPATPDRVARTAKHAKALERAERPPLTPSREDLLARLDGLVVGQRVANGIVSGRTFLHPDGNLLVEFPEKWEVENTPRRVVAGAPGGKAVLILKPLGSGSDPLDGARDVDKATSYPVSAGAERVTINGIPAAHTLLEADKRITLDVTWFAHGGTIYQLAGIAPRERFAGMQPIFAAAARSFRALEAAERAAIKERRLRLVKARAGETIEALAKRAGSAWSKEEIAVANGLAAADPLQEGQLLKVAVAEDYEPAKGVAVILDQSCEGGGMHAVHPQVATAGDALTQGTINSASTGSVN